MVFLTKMDGYRKMCDANKNVTRMSMIIKEVYYVNIFVMNPLHSIYLAFLLVHISFTKFILHSSCVYFSAISLMIVGIII